MTLEEAVAEFEANFATVSREAVFVVGLHEVAPEAKMIRLADGSVVVGFAMVHSGGIRMEGSTPQGVSFATREHAAAAWLIQALRYKRTVASGGQHLYWKELPAFVEGPGGRWCVYSRMFVSDKAPEAPKAETVDAGAA